MLGFINSNSSTEGGGWIRVTSDITVTREERRKIIVTQSDSKIYIDYNDLNLDQENVISNIGPAKIRIQSGTEEDKLKVNGAICGWCELDPNGNVYTKYENGYWCIYGVVNGQGSNIVANDLYIFNNGLVTGYNWNPGHVYTSGNNTYLRTHSASSAYINAGDETSDQYGWPGTVDETSLVINATGYQYLYVQVSEVEDSSSDNAFYFKGVANHYTTGIKKITIDQLVDNSAVELKLHTNAAPQYHWSGNQVWQNGQYHSITYKLLINKIWLSNTDS